jgi:hypothetical protein
VKWRQIPGTFPWRNVLLFAILSASQFLCWWSWNSLELSPLERYYLPAFYRCSESTKHPGSRCQFEPLFEAASGRKSRLVLSADVVPGKTGDLPLQLSGTALDNGWTGLTKGPLILDDSSAVESFLREAFYQGRTFGQLVQEPLWSGAIILLLVLAVASVSFGRILVSEWSDLWIVAAGAIWSSGPGWYSTTDRGLKDSSIGQLLTRLKSLWESGRKFLSSALRNRNGKDVSENTPKKSEKMWKGPLVSSHSTGTVPTPQSQLTALHVDRSNVSTKPRYIFPGKDGASAVNHAPRAWDQSQWID